MILALDPLFLDDIGLSIVLIALLKVGLAFVIVLISVMFMVWFERKVVSDMQHRIGPNIAGPWGLFQTLADGLKLLMKEDLVPDRSHRFVFKLAPFLAIVPAFLTFSIIPIGGNFESKDGAINLWGHDTFLQVADPPVGILLFLAMSSIAVYGVMLAGWSSGSKYPLLGSVRASAQMVSYEAALGLTIAAIVLQTGSLSTHDMVVDQATGGLGWNVPNWNLIATGFVPFVIFLIAGTAELNRPPFDLVEAEQELVGGFHTEYSSFRFALFFLAEYLNTITMSAIIVTVFLGGPAGPVLIERIDWVWGIVWFLTKLFVFLFSFVWFRATLPRFRYDQLMDLGWKILIPLSLGWFLFLGARNIGADQGWNRWAVVAVAPVVGAAAAALLMAAVRTARSERLSQEVDSHG